MKRLLKTSPAFSLTLAVIRWSVKLLAFGFAVSGVFVCVALAQSGQDDLADGVLAPEQKSEIQQKTTNMTIAVVINRLQADGSTWDIGFGADLILCGVRGCYVSGGLEEPAVFYEGTGAFRLLKKAGQCRDVLKCVFRSVDLKKLVSDEDRSLQMVDVDYVTHTYLGKFTVEKPFACALTGVLVGCKQGVHGRLFSLWAIDESLAKTSGKVGLDYVLFKGITAQRVEVLTARIADIRKEIRVSAGNFFKLVLDRPVPDKCLQQIDFLSEGFYVAGLADASQRRAELIIKDFVGAKSIERLKAIVQQSPQIYWAFLDIARQYQQFSRANTGLLRDGFTGVRLVNGESRGDVLEYGWEVQSRAGALVEGCQLK